MSADHPWPFPVWYQEDRSMMILSAIMIARAGLGQAAEPTP